MNKVKLILYMICTFMCFMIGATTVSAAGITCTYTLPYTGADYVDYTATLKYIIKDEEIITDGGEWTCYELSENSPCYYMNKTKDVAEQYVSVVNGLQNYENFYIQNNNKYSCPKISYAMYHDGINHWYVFVGKEGDYGANDPSLSEEEIEKRNSVSGKASNVFQPSASSDTTEKKDNVITCPYRAQGGVSYKLEIDTTTYNAKVFIKGKYVHDIKLDSAICPETNDLTYCLSAFKTSNDVSKDRISYQEGCYEMTLTKGLNTEEYKESYKTIDNNNITFDADGEMIDIVTNTGSTEADSTEDEVVDTTCEGLFGEIIEPLQEIYDWFKILAPALLIVFGSIDYVKAVISNDDATIKKATSSFIKRAIAAVAIFFLPLLINVIMKLPGIDIDNAVCGISKVVVLK